jgi:hypothetical protein
MAGVLPGASIFLLSCALFVASCDDHGCGPNMVYSAAAHACLCDATSVPMGGGCVACPAGKVPVGSQCACPTGQVAATDGSCQAAMALGTPCDGTKTCKDATFNYCGMPKASTAGSCTKRCVADGDCDAAYTCADWEPEPFCRVFTGATKACSTVDDCTGLDAPVCFGGQCRITNCTVTPMHAKDDCPKELVCCDVSFLGAPGVNTACVKPGMVCQ